MNKQKISYLQQALWKLERAKELLKMAYGGDDGSIFEHIETMSEEIIGDIAVEWEQEKV
jgi:hypothetical protein